MQKLIIKTKHNDKLTILLEPEIAQVAGEAAQAANDAASQEPQGIFENMGPIIMLLLFVAFIYFFMIRPQQKQQKEIRKFRESLAVGDKVITAGGIYGTIEAIKETYFILEIGDKVKIRIDKGSVYQSPESAQEAINQK